MNVIARGWRSALLLVGATAVLACGDDTAPTGGAGGEAPGGGGADEEGGGGSGEGGNGGQPDEGGGGQAQGGGGGEGGASSEGCGDNPGFCTCTVPAPSATRGDAIAISRDDDTIVVANRDTASVSVLAVAYDASGLPEMTKTTEVSVAAEPWEVAIDGCGERAFVISRREQMVIVLDDLVATPVIAHQIPVGSEPTGLALSPSGRWLYVANWVDGTVSVIDVDTMAVDRTIDLNGPLAATGLLGDTVTGRPALAHPRSIAVTNDDPEDGDDLDETIVVTEFFAQRTEPEIEVPSNVDTNWVGIVYLIDASDDAVETVPLGSLAAISDPPPEVVPPTGCFPNQLQGVTIHEGRAYVPSICASPAAPLSPQQMTQAVISVVDIAAAAEVGDEGTSLTRAMSVRYAGTATTGAAARMPLLANKIAFDTQGAGYVSANGADAVVRFDLDAASGAIASVGHDSNAFIDLAPGALGTEQMGQNPVGITAAHTRQLVFVTNDVSRNVTAIATDDAQAIAGLAADDARIVQSTALPANDPDAAALRGKRAWNTGLGRYSAEGRGWGACQSCHFEGLSDNVTWYFGRGPRQATSIDGSFASSDPNDQRIFNWTAVFDEVADFEGVLRSIDGGVGAVVHTVSVPPVVADRIDLAANGAAGLSGSAQLVMEQLSVMQTWADVEVFMERVRSPRAPTNLEPAQVAAGAALFQDGGCAGCHGGAKWTLSQRFYTPSNATNQALLSIAYDGPSLVAAGFPETALPALPGSQLMRSSVGGDQIQCVLRNVGTFGIAPEEVGIIEKKPDGTAAQGGAQNGLGYNVPSILGMQVGAPYFHAGNARTLEELLSDLFHMHATVLAADGFLEGANADADRKALAQYLLSIDESTVVIPLPASPGAQGGVICSLQ